MDDEEKKIEIRTNLVLVRCAETVTSEGEISDPAKVFELIKSEKNVENVGYEELRKEHTSPIKEVYEEQPSSSKDVPKITGESSKEASKEVMKRTSKTSKESAKETPKRASKTSKGSKETSKRSSTVKK